MATLTINNAACVFVIYPVNLGLLYKNDTVIDAREITPAGWSIPSEANCETLADYLGASGDYTAANTAGGPLKDTSGLYWDGPNTGATNSTLFNGRASGARNTTGVFQGKMTYIKFWTTYYSAGFGSYYTLTYNSEAFYRVLSPEKYGYSLRYIKDTTTLTNGQTGTCQGNDGKYYNTICIGTQEWLSSNSAETKFRNGDWVTGYDGGVYTPISDINWSALSTEALCAFDDDWNNV